jgi:DNA-binding CsgD family transcriptional regulator
MAEAAAAALRAAPDDAEVEGFLAGGAGMLELLWGNRAAALAALDRTVAAMDRVAHSAPSIQRALWVLLVAVTGRADAADSLHRARRSGITVSRLNRGYLRYAEAVLTSSADEVAVGDDDLRYFPVWQHLGRLLVAEAALAGNWGTPQLWLREAQDCFETHGLTQLYRLCAQLLDEPARWTPHGITVREAEVLRLLVGGLTNKEIAERLHLSHRTVEKHVESLLRKAGARSRTHLVAMVGETT